jgi:hypothetical protein
MSETGVAAARGYSNNMRNTHTSLRRGLVAGGLALGALVAASIPGMAGNGPGLVVDQSVVNGGDVTIGAANIEVRGGLSGVGASVSAGATGAAASVAASSIVTSGPPAGAIAFKDIRQHTENLGNVSSMNNWIGTGALSGKGTSVNISASGAVSSVSASAINSPVNATFSRRGTITQGANNAGSISVSGAIGVGRLSGAGVSVGVSAVGATSAITFSRIR